jgi:hypothetical protein
MAFQYQSLCSIRDINPFFPHWLMVQTLCWVSTLIDGAYSLFPTYIMNDLDIEPYDSHIIILLIREFERWTYNWWREHKLKELHSDTLLNSTWLRSWWIVRSIFPLTTWNNVGIWIIMHYFLIPFSVLLLVRVVTLWSNSVWNDTRGGDQKERKIPYNQTVYFLHSKILIIAQDDWRKNLMWSFHV